VGGVQGLFSLSQRRNLSSICRRRCYSLPFCLVADGQLVGQIVAAVVTFIGTGGAAFLGARAANRNTDVEDKRAKEIAEAEDRRTKEIAAAEDRRIKELAAAEAQRAKEAAEWDRIHRMVTMAFSTNPLESYVGVALLQKSKADWNPEQTKFIRDVLSALIAAPVQAYGGSQTTVVTSPSPVPTAPVAAQSVGGKP
jgi:hypothetical protein